MTELTACQPSSNLTSAVPAGPCFKSLQRPKSAPAQRSSSTPALSGQHRASRNGELAPTPKESIHTCEASFAGLEGLSDQKAMEWVNNFAKECNVPKPKGMECRFQTRAEPPK